MTIVRGSFGTVGTFGESRFLASVRSLSLYRPHMCAFIGSETLRKKKRAGERTLSFEDIRRQVRLVRSRLGAVAVASLINDLIADTLTTGERVDVVAHPIVDASPTATAREEAVSLCVASASLVGEVETGKPIEDTLGRVINFALRLAGATKSERSAA